MNAPSDMRNVSKLQGGGDTGGTVNKRGKRLNFRCLPQRKYHQEWEFSPTEFRIKPVWRISTVIRVEQVYLALWRWVAVSSSQCILGAEVSLPFELAKFLSTANSVK